MTTFFVLLLAAAGVAFVLTKKKSEQPIKLVGNVKKVEPVVEVKVAPVDVAVTTEVVKKVRKPRAKKITSKKKNNPSK